MSTPNPGALVVICDGQGDAAVYVVTPELFARMREEEVHRAADLLWVGEDPHPGVLRRIHCQHGVFELGADADLSTYALCGVLVDELC